MTVRSAPVGAQAVTGIVQYDLRRGAAAIYQTSERASVPVDGHRRVARARGMFLIGANVGGHVGGETWDARLDVPATTLDALIARFGEPAFVKIDVEGYELGVLRGLSRPLRALSFE